MRQLIFKVGVLLWLIILITQVYWLRKDVDDLKKIYKADTVTVTTYTIDPRQTDATPLITASGFKLHPRDPRKHKIIAVSRDLIYKFKFGQYVRLVGAGELDGIYVVQDVMNRRFKKRIDVLINPKDRPTMYRNAKLISI